MASTPHDPCIHLLGHLQQEDTLDLDMLTHELMELDGEGDLLWVTDDRRLDLPPNVVDHAASPRQVLLAAPIHSVHS